MRLKSKIWLSLAVLVTIVLIVDATLNFRYMSADLKKVSQAEARTVYGYIMATRRVYQQQFIDSGLPVNKETVGFLPAHLLNRVSQDYVNWDNRGMTFNNVSDRPRNPDNRADFYELEDMAWFRNNNKETTRVREVLLQNNLRVTQFSSPIWIETSCLKCHESAESSIDGLTDLYPDDPAFGYKVGDLRGLVSIRIPTSNLENRLLLNWQKHMMFEVSGYLLFFIIVGYLLDRLVTRRLSNLQSGAEEIADGNYLARLNLLGNDEISQLANSFDHMAGEIEKHSADLSKLSSVVEQSPFSVILTDSDVLVEYVNECFVKTTGYSRDEVLGNPPLFLQSGYMETEAYKSAMAKGEAWSDEFHNQHKDGTPCIDYTLISPIRNAKGVITHYVAVQQDITERKQAEEEIHRLAYFDSLTALPNRLHLSERLQQLLDETKRSKQSSALILLNIDRFTNVNNARGHEAGDMLLKELAARLSDLVRNEDILAYLSVDEFALVFSELGFDSVKVHRRAFIIAEKIHAALEQSFVIEGEALVITASLGVTLFPRGIDEMPDDVMRLADTALHRAKEKGGNETCFYEHDMGVRARERFLMERELRDAVRNEQLCLYLQPQVDAAGQHISAEVLVRWQHPERGLVPPVIFIPVAEESDLIIDLTDWIFTQACELIARQGMKGNTLRLSVNISPRHFRHKNFVAWITQKLEITGADPTLLTLEVTEGLMIKDVNEVIAKMNDLAILGIHFSIDDFGTGYSSLAYLKRLPISELKIDKMFVQDAPKDLDDAILVETILSVARHMGISVVAEGVETQEQADFLNERSSVVHQGYLYGKPAPAEEWLKRWESQE